MRTLYLLIFLCTSSICYAQNEYKIVYEISDHHSQTSEYLGISNQKIILKRDSVFYQRYAGNNLHSEEVIKALHSPDEFERYVNLLKLENDTVYYFREYGRYRNLKLYEKDRLLLTIRIYSVVEEIEEDKKLDKFDDLFLRLFNSRSKIVKLDLIYEKDFVILKGDTIYYKDLD